MNNRSPFPRQRVVVVASVVLLHVLALWALQTGLLQRGLVFVEEVVVPVELIAPQTPPQAKPPPTLPKPPPSAKSPVAAPAPKVAQPSAPAPVPLAIADATPSANAPVGAAVSPVPVPVVPGPPAPAPKVELPSSDAEYLLNPKSEYPRISRQRNEQGKVVVSVFIGTDGTAQKAEIKVSSGYERLDQAALATVKSWRYVPGKRGGVPEAMWFNVPINFVLE